MNRLIIVGSPRVDGRSAALADQLFEACIEECPDDEVFLAPVSTLDIAGCTGCNTCRAHAEEAVGDGFDVGVGIGTEDGGERAAESPCAIDDDMAEVYPLIEAADELMVVCPVYFAGAPSQMKALLDRLQPYFWAGARTAPKRPAVLHVVGEGGDPHGFDPLVGTVRSALAVAGFRLECVLNWVGKITEEGEIIADAEEHVLSAPVVQVAAFEAAGSDGTGEGDGFDREPRRTSQASAPNNGAEDARPPRRRKLDLGANGSERQVIALDEDGNRVDDARHGRKRTAEKRYASSKRGTGGVKQKTSAGEYSKGGRQGGKGKPQGGQQRSKGGASGKGRPGGKAGGKHSGGSSQKQGKRRG